MEYVLFFSLAAWTLVASTLLLLCRYVLHGALALVALAMGIAGFCALLGASFLGVASLLLCGGFGLVCALYAASLRTEHRRIGSGRDGVFYIAVFLGLVLVVQLLLSYAHVEGGREGLEESVGLAAVGHALYTDFLLPLHIVALLLLGSMLGIVALTRQRSQSRSSSGSTEERY